MLLEQPGSIIYLDDSQFFRKINSKKKKKTYTMYVHLYHTYLYFNRCANYYIFIHQNTVLTLLIVLRTEEIIATSSELAGRQLRN